MKTNRFKTLIGLLFAFVILFFAFSSARANLTMYSLSGYVTSIEGSSSDLEAAGYPPVSIGDSFVVSFFYSFDEEPDIIDECSCYDLTGIFFNATIHFDKFYVRWYLAESGVINSERTSISFILRDFGHETYTNSGYSSSQIIVDSALYTFDFSKRIEGDGWPKTLDSENFKDGRFGITWLENTPPFRSLGLGCKISAFKSVSAEGPPPCNLDSRFQETTLSQGIKYYTDRDYTLTSVPSQYLGMNIIKTPNDERNRTDNNDYMTFNLNEPANVYVAIDGRTTNLPGWMSGFTDTTERIYTSLSSQPYLKIFQKSYPAGCVNFGANKAPGFSGGTVSNYIVFYGTGSAPPAPLCILDSKFQETTLSQGIKYYTDRDYTLTNVPSQYVGMDLIKTPNDERNKTDENDYITFELNEPANVYVAIDGRTTSLPGWMSGFTDTTNRIYTSLDTQPYLKVYQKFYSTGGCVNFGANKASGFSGGTVSNYIVFR